ncbi:MAG: hypothetical protein RIT19_1982 [Verrucomicrobiota bacterium]|jgi:hypothetical protein
MLRARTPEGWFLITHPEHARIAGEFARAWGNDLFRSPFPRDSTLEGIRRHDDGWAVRDRSPKLTREGRPSAFGIDLVGKYSAFEEIDLADYLQVRGQAMEAVAAQDPYAAVLISMHTCNLLTERADHSTLRPEDRPRLAAFLESQQSRQETLRQECARTGRFTPQDLLATTWVENFRLLQACDNLSLLSCVDYPHPAGLLHPLPLNGGGTREVAVHHVTERTFWLDPWPFRDPVIEVRVSGRRVTGETFPSEAEIATAHRNAPTETLTLRITSHAPVTPA